MLISLPLFLSDVGGSEIVLILVVILVFFGSSSIPGIAKSMGKTIHQIKQASQEVQNEIKKSAGDVKTDFDLQKMVRETVDIVEKPLVEEAVKMDQIIDSPSEYSHPYIVKQTKPTLPATDIEESKPEVVAQQNDTNAENKSV